MRSSSSSSLRPSSLSSPEWGEINAELAKQLANMRRARPRSETLNRLEGQLTLPLDGIFTRAPARPEKDKDGKAKAKPRRGRHPGRASFPTSLKHVEVPNPVPPEQRICPLCGKEMTLVAHSRCETLHVHPAQVYVEVRVDETLACPADDTIVSSPVPGAIVERGKLGDSLIVEATCDKYLDHMPIERQCSRWSQHGVDIAPQTLRRAVSAHIDLLMPVAALIREQTRGPGLLGTDATGIPILDRAARDGVRTGTMWCWTNALWVSFFYSAVGDSDSVKRFLGEELARTVQCDGTSLTNCIEKAGGKRPGCWSHGRRRLVEAARAGDMIALEGVRKIGKIFEVERASKQAGDTAAQRRDRRQALTRPHLEDLRIWIDEHRGAVPPKTPLGAALGYLHRQWKRLVLFLEDGDIEATNNRRVRELRRLVLGRKNWLFTWPDVGGERTAAILSIVATCIAHDVNPRAYLRQVTKLIVEGWPQKRLRDLLPDRMALAHPELVVARHDAPPEPSTDTLPALA